MMALTARSVAMGEAHAQVAAGSDFDDFYRRELPALGRLAIALCGRRDLAEELVQDTMVKVLARWRRVRAYDKPGAFARRVLVNEAIGRHRRLGSERRALERKGVAADVVLPDESESFWALVRALPPRQRACISLYYVDDCTTAQIAAVLGVTEGTVRATLAHARDALRAQIEAAER